MPASNGSLGKAVGRKHNASAQSVPDVQEDVERPVKWTAVLDQSTVTMFERVTGNMRSVGRLAGGRYPSRADVLRAMVAVVDDDPDLAVRVADRITADLTARSNR